MSLWEGFEISEPHRIPSSLSALCPGSSHSDASITVMNRPSIHQKLSRSSITVFGHGVVSQQQKSNKYRGKTAQGKELKNGTSEAKASWSS